MIREVDEQYLAERQAAEAEMPFPALKRPKGGGTSGGVTDDWKNGVDRQLAQLHTDVRMLLAALIVGFLILAGGGWVVYSKLADEAATTRVEQVKQFGEQNTKNAEISAKLDLLLERKGAK